MGVPQCCRSLYYSFLFLCFFELKGSFAKKFFFRPCHYYIWCIPVFSMLTTSWGTFRQLLPFLSNRHLSLLVRGRIYSTCVRRALLHAAETWAVTVSTVNRLKRNNLARILNGKADFKIDLSKNPTLGKGKWAIKRI